MQAQQLALAPKQTQAQAQVQAQAQARARAQPQAQAQPQDESEKGLLDADKDTNELAEDVFSEYKCHSLEYGIKHPSDNITESASMSGVTLPPATCGCTGYPPLPLRVISGSSLTECL